MCMNIVKHKLVEYTIDRRQLVKDIVLQQRKHFNYIKVIMQERVLYFSGVLISGGLIFNTQESERHCIHVHYLWNFNDNKVL